jgi:hypothetical protein
MELGRSDHAFFAFLCCVWLHWFRGPSKGNVRIANKTQGLGEAWRCFRFRGGCCTMLHSLHQSAGELRLSAAD